MAKAYVIHEGGKTTAMQKVRCKDEERELQDILEHNPDLLPGDQIDQENPRRWMLIKVEMPVPDPNDGSDRWNIDFLFVDQDAMPTFVECKRFADTRSRREVIAQMLEYAANGHHYWAKKQIRDYAEQTAQSIGRTIEQALQELVGYEQDPDAFFEKVECNLREAQLRLIFFLEEAPMELRSIVDFLNKQMEKSEVLIVEARQFESDGVKVVIPLLFGFTEQARQVKERGTTTIPKSGNKWDEQKFFEKAKTLNQFSAVEKVYRCLKEQANRLDWGTGTAGKALARFTGRPGWLFTVDAEGLFETDLKPEEAKQFEADSGLSSDSERFEIGEWADKADTLVKAITTFAANAKAGSQASAQA